MYLLIMCVVQNVNLQYRYLSNAKDPTTLVFLWKCSREASCSHRYVRISTQRNAYPSFWPTASFVVELKSSESSN